MHESILTDPLKPSKMIQESVEARLNNDIDSTFSLLFAALAPDCLLAGDVVRINDLLFFVSQLDHTILQQFPLTACACFSSSFPLLFGLPQSHVC
jgi:hypothetical protein